MVLIFEGKFITDSWVHGGVYGKKIISPLAQATPQTEGILLPNTAKQSDFLPFLQANLLAIDFPTFSDGRGFSLARLIRRHGFTKELRAFGNLVPDQYAAALACGFDTIEISAERALRQSEISWGAAYAARNLGYQRGYMEPVSILDARRKSK